MKNLSSTLSLLFIFLSLHSLHAQEAPSIEWQKCLGGADIDEAYSIQETTDDGFIAAGYTWSNDGDVSGNHSFLRSDDWIVKLDASGNLIWQKCLGGFFDESAMSIQQTTDGGFILAGYSTSNDGDVTGNHGDGDYWIVKLDSIGNIVWQKCLGGTYGEVAVSIDQTFDGDYLVAGSSESIDGDVSGNHGNLDYWIVKLDSAGNIIKDECFGGSKEEETTSIHQAFDGGFIVAGYSSSNSGQFSGNHGYQDYWILKFSANGDIEWQKLFGGNGNDFCNAVVQTPDSGFVFTGTSNSNSDDVSGNHGYNDFWVMKLNGAGSIVWQKCYGGSADDDAYSIMLTSDGGFIVSGSTESVDGDVTGKHSYQDYWIIKIDSVGNLQWQKCLGGNGTDWARAAQETPDGGFIVAGQTYSSNGDVTGNHGNGDYWVVKLSAEIVTGIPFSVVNMISLFPNPVHNLLTIDLGNQITNQIITVYDLQGRMISLTASFQNNQAQLNTENLPNGFYTLQVTDKYSGKTSFAKFVKR